MVTDLKLQDSCTAWVHDYEAADEQERRLIIDLANAIAHGLKLIGVPAFILEMEEYNYPKNLSTMHFKMAKTTCENSCVLGVTMSKTLFETTSTQDYHAENHDNHELDYDGQLRIGVILEGVWDDVARCHSQSEMAEIIVKLAAGYYYEKILKFYPEWSTAYEDAPIMVTQPIEHL